MGELGSVALVGLELLLSGKLFRPARRWVPQPPSGRVPDWPPKFNIYA